MSPLKYKFHLGREFRGSVVGVDKTVLEVVTKIIDRDLLVNNKLNLCCDLDLFTNLLVLSFVTYYLILLFLFMYNCLLLMLLRLVRLWGFIVHTSFGDCLWYFCCAAFSPLSWSVGPLLRDCTEKFQ